MDENETTTISNFKEIINHFFYDWGMTNGPQIQKEDGGQGYWINKTALDLKSLSYKTEYYEVEESAFVDFEFFFEHLYKDDSEFDLLMGKIADEWHGESEFKKTNVGYKIGKLSIFEIDGIYQASNNCSRDVISKDLYSKIEIFFKLLEH